MSVFAFWYMACTECGRQRAFSAAVAASEARKLAKCEGWIYKRFHVNGSMWDFCPKCVQEGRHNR